ncbi:hypothetical protein KQX54_012958 [Cotesia glomerata]|uniref:Uncharacterized protein n=1 Tax=Cotesia glomerata TaxID=32391 RepID=A0AAV7IRP3_COTGL|nr:hypothetical protein KQX54_012958 [Cotesia glomerata]
MSGNDFSKISISGIHFTLNIKISKPSTYFKSCKNKIKIRGLVYGSCTNLRNYGIFGPSTIQNHHILIILFKHIYFDFTIDDHIYNDIILDEIELDELYEIDEDDDDDDDEYEDDDDYDVRFKFWKHRLDSSIPEEDEDVCDDEQT